LASLMARVTIQAVETLVHDPVRAQVLGEQALVLARELGDQAAEAKSLWNLSLAYYYGNRLVQAIEYGERSLALAREHNLREQMAQTLNDLGSICYIYSGRIQRAKEVLHEASLLWRELGNLPMLADSLASSAVAHVFAGEFDQAIAFSEEAYQIGHSIDNLWAQSYSRWKVGRAYWERGEWGQAISVMEESIRLGELAGFPPPQANTRAELAALYGDLGAVERGLETARLALSVAETQNPVQRSFTLSILTCLQLLNGDVADAKATIEEAKNDLYRNSGRGFFDTVTIAEAELGLKLGDFRQALAATDALLTDLRQYGMRVHKAYALYLQGQALWGLGQEEAARDRFLEARAEAEAIGSRRTLWRILYALSQLEAEPMEAERLRQGARRVIEYIADHIGQVELRESFLYLPDVQVVLAPVEVR
jgi:tetratricopeptide (TPR) repeat protein